MPARTLTQRELNRTLLARQLLLQRHDLTPTTAIERLMGLQAQVQNPPYIGLWTRLQNFEKADLTRLIEGKKVIRAPMLRSTLHLLTTPDYLQFRAAIQPALLKAMQAFNGKFIKGLDTAQLAEQARPFFEAQPRSQLEQRDFLTTLAPERDANALAYVVRSYLPLIQTPPGGIWGKGGSTPYALADRWLEQPLNPDPDPCPLLWRYLAAFGPASVMDMQAWSGLPKLKDAVASMREQLIAYQDESGKELFDLPDGEISAADTPAPVRFIPEYDNLIISHADRTRIIADADRPKVFLSAARVLSTFLVDGFVAGTWKAEVQKKTATLVITPFAKLTASARKALLEEGERLLRFIEEDAATYEIRFVEG